MGNKNISKHYISPEPTTQNNNSDRKSNSWFLITQEQDSMFEPVPNKEVKSGSSPSRYFVRHKPSGTQWLCKCSALSIIRMNHDNYTLSIDTPTDSINQYKEVLALGMYSLFGVRIPQTVLSKQIISNEAKKMLGPVIKDMIYQNPKMQRKLGLQVPRTHILSKFIRDYKPLGKKFIQEYGKINKNFYCVSQNVHLVGFGRAIAVATFLHDYDCVGDSGNNMGYVIHKGKATIVKIDAGEALSFLDDMKNSEVKKQSIEWRDMIISTHQTKIPFQKLTQKDKKEFIKTTKDILTVKVEEVEHFFKQFIGKDARFKEILLRLLDRKTNFLSAFSPEVSSLIQEQLKQLEESFAISIYQKWSSSVYVPGRRRELVESHALLHSYQLSKLNNNFQIPKPNQYFVSRDN